MRKRTLDAINCVVTNVLLCLVLALSATRGHAADKQSDTFCHNGFAKDGTCLQAEPDDIQALHAFMTYCDILSRRDLRGVPLDPKLTDEEADKFRTDSYNDTEKKLAVLRQKLMKLDHGTVETVLDKQMQIQDPNDPDNLMCALEIVARIFPQEYDGYQKMIKPGVDSSGFIDYIRDTFLGKNAALHEDYHPRTR